MGRAGGAVAGLGVGVAALAGLSIMSSDPQGMPAPTSGALSVIVEPPAQGPEPTQPPAGSEETLRAGSAGPASGDPAVPEAAQPPLDPTPLRSVGDTSVAEKPAFVDGPGGNPVESMAAPAPSPWQAADTVVPAPAERLARSAAGSGFIEPSAVTALAAAAPMTAKPEAGLTLLLPDAPADVPIEAAPEPSVQQAPATALVQTPQPALPSPDAAPGHGSLVAALPSQASDAAPVVRDPSAADAAPMSDDPDQPPSVVAMHLATNMPPADLAPVQPAVAPAPVSPSPDGITLAQATEPAAPIPAEPGRVQLEGGALPGTDAVRVRRPEADAAPAAPEPITDALADDVPAFGRFAAPFTPPEPARPLLSLVLLDDGTRREATADLEDLAVPVSIALDPSAGDAADRMAAYRAAGHEVLVLARLPVRAQPQDVEVFLAPALAALPEAVAVLDVGEGGLRNRDETAEMALSLLARSGLGAVLLEGGFGRGAEAAQAAGVPAAELLRDLDGAGQDGAAIRRQLDDAVRRAGQEGGAVVLARLRPQTLEALAAWAQDRRAQEVALAPVSALLADAP